jgi:predicted secreted protein
MSLIAPDKLFGRKLLLILASAAAALPAAAQPVPEPYDRVDLSASAEMAVDNDLLIAIVYSEVQDERQAAAADQVNEAIQWAVREAERVREVRSQTLQYASFPVYGSNRRIVAWQARQSLRLESRDAERLSDLLATLQDRVAVQSVNYDVSKQARDAADEALIAEALAQFNRRAALVAEELGRPGYRLVRLSIGTSGDGPSPIAYRAAQLETAVAAPALEAGVQTVSVSVSGTIELNSAR